MIAAAIIPPKVARGATIGVCAPAGPVPVERLRRGVDRLAETFHVRLTPSLTAPRAAETPAYLSAPDDVRVAELESLLADPDVRAIVVARGGYGIMRILPRLDPELLRRDPKPIVGFSDATALLAWAYAAGVRGIHGPVVGQLGELGEDDVARVVTMLTDPRARGVEAWPLVAHGGAGGVLRGTLVAGNLTMVSLLAASPWPVPLDGAIALIEEVGERPYEIDRYLTSLRLAHALDHTRAIVLGDLVRCNDERSDGHATDVARATFLECVRPLPVASGAPVGHGARNAAIPFGATCDLDLDAGTLAIHDAAVS